MARKDKRRPRRPNVTGRTDKSPRFAMLKHKLLESAAYASLDLAARGALQELVMIYNGRNNGSLWLSVRDLTARLGLSDVNVGARALRDLEDRGFITMAKEAHFAMKAAETSRARCWRLTWEAWPECPQPTKRAPTNEWQHWILPACDTPENRKVNRRVDRRLRTLAQHRKDELAGKMPVLDSNTTAAIQPRSEGRAVLDSNTLKAENGANPPFVVGEDSNTHIDDTMGRGRLRLVAAAQ